MESTLYTIESDAGPYVAADPSMPECMSAWIYHDQSAAVQVIEQTDNPTQWRVVPVNDLEAWLDSLLGYDITHVVESLLPTHSTTRTTAGWLLRLRAQQSGRELPKRS